MDPSTNKISGSTTLSSAVMGKKKQGTFKGKAVTTCQGISKIPKSENKSQAIETLLKNRNARVYDEKTSLDTGKIPTVKQVNTKLKKMNPITYSTESFVTDKINLAISATRTIHAAAITNNAEKNLKAMGLDDKEITSILEKIKNGKNLSISEQDHLISTLNNNSQSIVKTLNELNTGPIKLSKEITDLLTGPDKKIPLVILFEDCKNAIKHVINSNLSEKVRDIDGDINTLGQITQQIADQLDDQKNTLEQTKNDTVKAGELARISEKLNAIEQDIKNNSTEKEKHQETINQLITQVTELKKNPAISTNLPSTTLEDIEKQHLEDKQDLDKAIQEIQEKLTAIQSMENPQPSNQETRITEIENQLAKNNSIATSAETQATTAKQDVDALKILMNNLTDTIDNQADTVNAGELARISEKLNAIELDIKNHPISTNLPNTTLEDIKKQQLEDKQALDKSIQEIQEIQEKLTAIQSVENPQPSNQETRITEIANQLAENNSIATSAETQATTAKQDVDALKILMNNLTDTIDKQAGELSQTKKAISKCHEKIQSKDEEYKNLLNKIKALESDDIETNHEIMTPSASNPQQSALSSSDPQESNPNLDNIPEQKTTDFDLENLQQQLDTLTNKFTIIKEEIDSLSRSTEELIEENLETHELNKENEELIGGSSLLSRKSQPYIKNSNDDSSDSLDNPNDSLDNPNDSPDDQNDSLENQTDSLDDLNDSLDEQSNSDSDSEDRTYDSELFNEDSKKPAPTSPLVNNIGKMEESSNSFKEKQLHIRKRKNSQNRVTENNTNPTIHSSTIKNTDIEENLLNPKDKLIRDIWDLELLKKAQTLLTKIAQGETNNIDNDLVIRVKIQGNFITIIPVDDNNRHSLTTNKKIIEQTIAKIRNKKRKIKKEYSGFRTQSTSQVITHINNMLLKIESKNKQEKDTVSNNDKTESIDNIKKTFDNSRTLELITSKSKSKSIEEDGDLEISKVDNRKL